MTLKVSGKGNHNDSDLKMIEEYRRSADIDILGSLYKQYMHLVYGVCLKYFKDRDESQDAVMSIFEKLITELEKHTIENFKSWLYVLTKNYCLMHLRKSSAERHRLNKMFADETSIMEISHELHPIDKDNGISDRALEDCIENLKDEQMRCIRLFYYESRCYREIAETLKMDEKKVKSHLQNAKRNLKICLESNND